MSISRTMEEAIINNNIPVIRSSFYTIVLSDPGFTTGRFEEALQYVKSKHISGMIDEHDHVEFRSESEWDEEYCSLLASQLQDNFSLERIEHLIQVSKKVYSIPEKTIDKATYNTAYNTTHKATTKRKETEETDEYLWLKMFGLLAGMALFIRWIFKGDK